ncbi:RNA polymerase II subunit A C-terminal domain phosphatase [Hondaea fermentalgiana]|uniref:protein-serine/threonine phosphatase n=1 Tax=Hondaea fermentalgiana TaxID=2315210 RepID=A0A2R5GU34_9STRA|nr:RNA polymerase II subunit A C-terminal domain phosphatase [Hondaea fermentalgiana]|eukprot:GBG31901.1 RNA polymerase II subunit A C-terminal domain phosphatase [Hondaea fermentalgiana]
MVVDLDHTLVHASSEIPSRAELEEQRDEHFEHMDVFRIDISALLAKLCRMNFVLVAFTQGATTYARQILRILDPRGAIFGTRLIAAPDCSADRPIKTFAIVAETFKVEAHQILVLDDRVDVWGDIGAEENRLRVIRVKPFLWFRGSNSVEAMRRIKQLHGVPVKAHLTMDFDDSKFIYLERIGDLVVDIWHRSLLAPGKGLYAAARAIRRRVLEGKVLLMDRVGTPGCELHIEATDAGATLQTTLDDSTTCVVTSSLTASAVLTKAMEKGTPVYKVEWLLECLNRWEVIDGEPYVPPFASKPTRTSPRKKRRTGSITSNS